MELAMANPRSTASIGGHPLHPMVIPFPIASFVGAFLCDLVMLNNASPFWQTAALYLLGAGIVMAAVAAVLGLIDFFGEPRIRALSDAWMHAGANVLAVVIEAYNFYIRYAGTGSKNTGLILSLIVVCILLFSGWKGWGMVYKHHVAVSDVAERPR
jgi:uncharacterized membrane protein